MQFNKVKITPKRAEEMLGKNSANRGMSSYTWKNYANLMRSGKWGECPQPIVVNGDGTLIDGQHRLRAVIEYGKPVEFWVASGASGDVRENIDKGRKRTVANTLSMEYGIKNAGRTAAVAKYIVAFSTGEYRALNHHEVLDTLKKHRRTFEWIENAPMPVRFRGAYFLGPLAWVHKKFADDVELFHLEVVTGEQLKKNSPSLKLRELILTSESAGVAQGGALALKTLAALKASINGRSVKTLKAGLEPYRYFRKALRCPVAAEQWAAGILEMRR